jgi:hypothetical protein
MDTAWIQVFVLTLSECVAPAGKTVCQEREFDLQFLTRADCEFALQQLVSLKQSANNVIVDAGKSRCVVSTREGRVFASSDSVRQPFAEGGSAPQGPRQPPQGSKQAQQAAPEYAAHQERLAGLPECGAADGVAPCRIGDIIIEEATSSQIEVWRKDN